jgi:hypothetical protein
VAKDIREHGAASLIVAGLWGYTGVTEGGSSARLGRLQKSLTASIAATLVDVVEQVKAVDAKIVSRA